MLRECENRRTNGRTRASSARECILAKLDLEMHSFHKLPFASLSKMYKVGSTKVWPMMLFLREETERQVVSSDRIICEQGDRERSLTQTKGHGHVQHRKASQSLRHREKKQG